MAKEIIKAIRIFLLLLVLTGIIYPLAVYFCGQLLFREQANGSLVVRNNKVIGSKLLAQKFSKPYYFHARPSATNYATIGAGGSNLAPSSLALRAQTLKFKEVYGGSAPPDLVTTSGSGLDPHISIEAALYQLPRIADSLTLSPKGFMRLRELVMMAKEVPTFGVLGKARVNVLKLNLLLEKEFSHE